MNHRENKDAAALSANPSSPILLSVTTVLIFALSGIILPLIFLQSPLLPIFAWIVFILCAATTLVLTKRIFMCIIIVMLFASAVPHPAIIGIAAAIWGYIVSVGLLSSQVLIGGRLATAAIIASPVCSYLITLLLTSDPIISCLSVICLPTAIGIGLSKKHASPLTTVCVTATIASLATLCAVIVTDILTAYGYFSIDLLSELITGVEMIAVEILKNAFITAGTAVTQAVSISIEDTVAAGINMLPGFVCVSALILAYFSEGICRKAAESADVDGGDDTVSYTTLSAVLFIIFYILSFTTDASGNVAFMSIISANLSIMLLPGLLIIGFKALTRMIFKLGFIGLILAAAAVFATFSFSIYVPALIGAAYTVVVNIDAWAKDHYGKSNL